MFIGMNYFLFRNQAGFDFYPRAAIVFQGRTISYEFPVFSGV
jgi:hypothetical protein